MQDVQLTFTDYAPPKSLTDDEVLALWCEKIEGAHRVSAVVKCFPQHQQHAVAMATSLVGGLKAWRDAKGVKLYIQDIQNRFLSHYKREQSQCL